MCIRDSITVIIHCHCHLAVTHHDMHTHHMLSQCQYYCHYTLSLSLGCHTPWHAYTSYAVTVSVLRHDILSLSLGCHIPHTWTLSSFVTTIRDWVFDPSPYPVTVTWLCCCSCTGCQFVSESRLRSRGSCISRSLVLLPLILLTTVIFSLTLV